MEFKTSKQNLMRKPSMEQNLLSESFIFTKDNVRYGIRLAFPNGSFLINYDDVQYPIIPFAFESYDDDLKENNKHKINQYNNQKIENTKINANKLLEISKLSTKTKNNELNENINYAELRSQIDELKKNVQLLNEKSNNRLNEINDKKNRNNNLNLNNERKIAMTNNLKIDNKEFKNIGNYRYQNQNQNDEINDINKNIYSNYNDKNTDSKSQRANIQNQNIKQYQIIQQELKNNLDESHSQNENAIISKNINGNIEEDKKQLPDKVFITEENNNNKNHNLVQKNIEEENMTNYDKNKEVNMNNNQFIGNEENNNINEIEDNTKNKWEYRRR